MIALLYGRYLHCISIIATVCFSREGEFLIILHIMILLGSVLYVII